MQNKYSTILCRGLFLWSLSYSYVAIASILPAQLPMSSVQNIGLQQLKLTKTLAIMNHKLDTAAQLNADHLIFCENSHKCKQMIENDELDEFKAYCKRLDEVDIATAGIVAALNKAIILGKQEFVTFIIKEYGGNANFRRQLDLGYAFGNALEFNRRSIWQDMREQLLEYDVKIDELNRYAQFAQWCSSYYTEFTGVSTERDLKQAIRRANQLLQLDVNAGKWNRIAIHIRDPRDFCILEYNKENIKAKAKSVYLLIEGIDKIESCKCIIDSEQVNYEACPIKQIINDEIKSLKHKTLAEVKVEVTDIWL